MLGPAVCPNCLVFMTNHWKFKEQKAALICKYCKGQTKIGLLETNLTVNNVIDNARFLDFVHGILPEHERT